MNESEAIVEAAKTGDVAKVRELVRSNPSLARTRLTDGETPLMAALYRGHRPVVDVLIEALGSVDMFAAAALGRPDELGPALGRPARSNTFAYDGWTPLHLAAFFGTRKRRRCSWMPAPICRRCRATRCTTRARTRPPPAGIRRCVAADQAWRRREGPGCREAYAAAHCRRERPGRCGRSAAGERRGSAGRGCGRSDAVVACGGEERSEIVDLLNEAS